MQAFSKRDDKSLNAINRLLLGLGFILAVGALAMGVALSIYTFFFFIVILDDFAVSVVAQQFYVNAIAASVLIPLELYLQLRWRRSLVQYSFILVIIAISLDTAGSVMAFYDERNEFFAYLASSIGLNRYSSLLLANEILASIIAVLGGIVVCIAFQGLPQAFNLIDPRRDQKSNRKS